jgi:Family of unknown function (DUF6636)
VRRLLLLLLVLALAMPAGASAFELRMFRIPGGNIGCAMIYGRGSGGGSARCDIARKTWQAPPKPRWCDVDWGFGLAVGARKRANFVCAGDTVLNQGRVLRTGRVARLGPFRCKSLPGAVRCVNRSTHHGFRLSRKHARRF